MFSFKSLIIGFILGLALVAGIGWTKMPEMMIIEYQSPHNLNDTVEKIKNSALAEGWVVAGIKPIHKSIKKHKGHDVLPVMLINICQADHAYKILKEDKYRTLSVMMPCTISVYEKQDGKTYIGAMNASLLGKMFGGDIAEIMGEDVASEQQKFINAALNQ